VSLQDEHVLLVSQVLIKWSNSQYQELYLCGGCSIAYIHYPTTTLTPSCDKHDTYSSARKGSSVDKKETMGALNLEQHDNQGITTCHLLSAAHLTAKLNRPTTGLPEANGLARSNHV
jgi:hypothetical protein